VERTTITGETEVLGENLPQRRFVPPQIPHDQVRFRTPDRSGGTGVCCWCSLDNHFLVIASHAYLCVKSLQAVNVNLEHMWHECSLSVRDMPTLRIPTSPHAECSCRQVRLCPNIAGYVQVFWGTYRLISVRSRLLNYMEMEVCAVT
jgi:hypothetical protein